MHRTPWLSRRTAGGSPLAATGGKVTVLDIASGDVALSVAVDRREASGVTFLSNGRLVVVGAVEEGKVKVLDAETGREVRSFETVENRLSERPATTFAVSPDERYLATAGRNYNRPPTVRLWNLSTGDLLRSFRGHTDAVFGVAFSPDGERLATASLDRTARVWDVASGRELRNLAAHSSALGTVAFARDGTEAYRGRERSEHRDLGDRFARNKPGSNWTPGRWAASASVRTEPCWLRETAPGSTTTTERSGFGT